MQLMQLSGPASAAESDPAAELRGLPMLPHDPCPKPDYRVNRQGLGEEIRQLLDGADVLQARVAPRHPLSHVMVAHLDVLRPLVPHRVLPQRDGALIVDVDDRGSRYPAPQIPQKLPEVDGLLRRRASCHVLRLSG